MSNNLLLVIADDNILHLSLKYCNNMKFIISSDNVKITKQFYKNNNVDIDNNLITTLETRSDKINPSVDYNIYDKIFNSILFFSKIINKIYFQNNIKPSILFCISKKHVKRSVILCSYILKDICIKLIYNNNEELTIQDTINEKHQIDLFYQSHYYKK